VKAVVFKKYGTPDVLHIADIPKPIPNEKEVLIKVAATTVTSGDVKLRKADPFLVRLFFGFTSPKRPVLGVEYAGTVEVVGKAVTQFKPGDRVLGSMGFAAGTYQEYIVVKEESVITHIPEGVSFEHAAAIPFGGLTSLYFLQKAGVLGGKRLLVYGASGALGTAAVQLAVYLGAHVTGVCSKSNTNLVRNLGASEVLNYENGIQLEQESFDIVYDTVGKSPFQHCVEALKPNGFYLRAVHYSPGVLLKGMIVNLTSSKKVVGGVVNEKREDLQLLAELVKAGRYQPVIGKTYPLEETAEAHRYVDTGHKKGNVVITVS